MQKPDNQFISITPLILFIILFFCSSFLLTQSIAALLSCCVAIIYSLIFTFNKNSSFCERVTVLKKGCFNHIAITTVFVLFLSSIFTYILGIIGGTESAVHIGLAFIPSWCILPGFFTIVSFFSTAIGSSMGAIATFIPIGIGIAKQMSIDPAMMCGIVVGGAMLGDNLSIISDTTIAATQTTQCKMSDKFKVNVLLVLPAFISTFLLLFYINNSAEINHSIINCYSFNIQTVIPLLPYLSVIIVALLNVNVITTLGINIIFSMIIGFKQENFTFLEGLKILFIDSIGNNNGLMELLLLIILISCLSYIVKHNGGIFYLLKLFDHKIKNKTHAEIAIFLLVFLVNTVVAINTIAILITGPVAKSIGDQFYIKKERVASLIDIVACICQGILPYAPQLLLAGSLAHISSISIMPYLYYQWFMGLVIACSIAVTAYQK